MNPAHSVGKIVEHSVSNNAPTKPSLAHSAAPTKNGSDGLGSRGPITVNGVHPITHRKPTVQVKGTAVSHASTLKKPSEELIREQGAVTDKKLGDGKKEPPKDVSGKVSMLNKASGESKSIGSVEGEKRTAAQIMYPKKLGLRGMVA